MIQHTKKRKINEVDTKNTLTVETKNRKQKNKGYIYVKLDDEEDEIFDEILEEEISFNKNSNDNNNDTDNNNTSVNNNNKNNDNNDNDSDSSNLDNNNHTHEIWKSIGLNSLDMKVLYQYIKSKGDLSIINSEGYGLIYLAAKNNSLEALRILLLQSDASLLVNKLHGPHSELALHAAASVGNFDAIEILIEHGSQVDVKDTLGHTPLSNSLFANNITCTEFFITSGAPVQTIDTQGNTLLHLAVSNHFTEAIPLLIQHGVDIDQVNQRGLSPLAVAIGFGYKDIVDALIKGGADVNGKTRFGKVIHHAVTWNRIDALESLINAGAEVNVVNAMEETPLLVAVQQRKIDIVRLLLKHGADPCFSPSPSSPSTNISLLYAANHGCTELCSLLINQDTSSYFIRQAADMSERASFPLTSKYLRSRLYSNNVNYGNKDDNNNNSNNGSNNNNNDNSTNGNSLILPTNLHDEDTNRNFENDFNSLINTFSDDDDDNNSNNTNNNNNGQSQLSNSPSISGQV